MAALVGAAAAPASRFNNIAVFCGANPGARPEYAAAAEALAKEMVHRRVGLVYGGGSVGIMGVVSRAVHSAGGRVLGVIPVDLSPVELSGPSVGEVRVVPDMHSRKAQMAESADAFIALPGGYGTLEEVLEAITWHQLGFSAKPVGFLNVDGFYDPLLAFFEHATNEGFIKRNSGAMFVTATTAAELLDALEAYTPPQSLLEAARAAAAAAGLPAGVVPDADPAKFM